MKNSVTSQSFSSADIVISHTKTKVLWAVIETKSAQTTQKPDSHNHLMDYVLDPGVWV